MSASTATSPHSTSVISAPWWTASVLCGASRDASALNYGRPYRSASVAPVRSPCTVRFMQFIRPIAPILLTAILVALAASRAHAFFPFGFGGIPGGETEASNRLDVDRLLPFFSASTANFVVRINPNSDRMADPVLRDATLAFITMATKGVPDYPLAMEGKGAALFWAEPGRTMTDYELAQADFGGPAEDVVAIAEKVGMIRKKTLDLHRDIAVGTMADRRTLRKIFQALNDSGYRSDEAGLRVDRDGEVVKIYLRPTTNLSPEQVGHMEAIKSFGSHLGITFLFQTQEPLSEQALITTDALISVESADRQTSLEGWIGAFTLVDEIEAFIDALPSDLSASQQVTALALIDQFRVKSGYVVPLAVLPVDNDTSTVERRHGSWKPMLAESYLKGVCGGNWRLRGYGATEAGFFHIDPTHPLVILLPEDGGSIETFGIYASKDQVGIENRGVLVFDRAAAPEGEAPRVFENSRLEVPVERLGVSNLLLMSDPSPYFRLVEEYDSSEFYPSEMEYRILDRMDSDKRRKIPDDAQGVMETRSIRLHDVSANVVQCARALAESNASLEFGPASSLE